MLNPVVSVHCNVVAVGLGLPYIHCAKGGQILNEVITSADVQFSTQNQVKSKKKKVITSTGRNLPSPELKLPKIFV